MEVYLNLIEKEIKNLGGKIKYANNAFDQFCGQAWFEFKFVIGEAIEDKDYSGSYYAVSNLYVFFRKNDNNHVEFSDYYKHICMTFPNSMFKGDENDGYLIRISLFKFLDQMYKNIHHNTKSLWDEYLLDENNVYHKDKQFSELLNRQETVLIDKL